MRILSRLQIGLRRALIVLALLGLAALFYLRTGHFQRLAERRVVAAVEEATGGRVELGDFHLSVAAREVHLRSLTIRSREAPGLPPLFQADSVLVRVRVLSLLEPHLELRLLRADRPRVQVAFDAQGRSNVPKPHAPSDPRRSPFDPVFDLAIGRLELLDGELTWNGTRASALPGHFAAEDLSASLRYEPARDRYAGTLSWRDARLAFPGYPAPQPASGAGREPASAAALVWPSWSARVSFTAGRRLLEVTDLAWQTPRSRLQASGTLSDFRRPVLDLTYEAALDLSEAGALLGLPAPRAGLLNIKGSGHFEEKPGPFRAVGEARLEGAVLAPSRLAPFAATATLSGVSGSARYEMTGDTLVLQPLQLSLLGGQASGQMRAERLWDNPRFILTGDVQGAGLVPLSAALAGKDLVDRLRWAASLSGETELRFTGRGRDLEVTARLSAAAPGAVPPGYVPLRGRAEIHYAADGQRLTLRDTLLETPGGRVVLDGGLGGKDQRLNVSLTTSHPAEWESLGSPPVKLLGSAEFRGAVWGALRAPVLEGTFRLGQFEYQGRRFDRFAGKAVYWPNERLEISDGLLERGAASALLTAAIPLTNGTFSETAPFTATAEVRRADLDALGDLADRPIRVTGTLTASLKAGGTRQDPQVSGAVEVAHGEAYGQPFDRLRANLRFAGRSLEATKLDLTRGKARAGGSLSYHLDQRSYRFELAGSNLSLAEFGPTSAEALAGLIQDGAGSGRLQWPRLSLAGLADFRAAGRGNGRAHQGQADLRIQVLAVNGEHVGNLSADLRAMDDRLALRIGSNLDQGSLEAQGNLSLREPYSWQGRVEFTDLDLDPLLEPWLGGRITAHSRSDGTVALSGDLRRTESLDISGELRRFQIAIQNVELRNQGALRARYSNRTLELQQVRLVGKDVDLEVSSGQAGMPVLLQANGQVNLPVLKNFLPGLMASGQAAVTATATGAWAQPLLRGRVEIREGLLGMEGFPNTLTRLNGTLRFNDTSLDIERLTGESGGGQVRFAGSLDYARRPVTFQLRAQAEGVRVRYPPGVSTMLDAGLNLTGNVRRSVLSGQVMVTRAAVNPNFDLAVALSQWKQDSPRPGGENWAQSLELDLRVASSADIRFESSRTRNLEGEANLRLRGTLEDPALLGRVNILQGQVAFAGNVYTINRGEISFLNPFRVEPVVNLDVSTRKQQYDISLDFRGPLDKLNVNYRSDPPLPVSDIQMLLLVGRAPQSTALGSAPDPALARIGSQAVLSQALDSAVSSRLERFFGASRLKIDPQVGGPENNPNARLTLEQQVGRDVTLTYITSLSAAQQQIIQVEWAVSPRFSILATRDQNGLFGLDLRWKKRFR